MSGVNNFQKSIENYNNIPKIDKKILNDNEVKLGTVSDLLEKNKIYNNKVDINTKQPNKSFDPAGPSLFNETNNVPKTNIEINSSPKLEDIKSGKATLQENQTGDSVKILKDNLTKLGFNVSKNNTFDSETKKAVENIQSSLNLVNKKSDNFGKVGKTTLAEIEKLAKTFTGNSIPESIEGRKLRDASAKIAGNNSSGGRCYTGVWAAIQKTNLDKKGITPPSTDPARDFGEWGLKDGKKVMGRVMPFLDQKGNLVGLKQGDIIVYERGVQGHHPIYGHIEIYGGGKNFYSDFNSGETGYNQLVTGIKNGQIKNGEITILRLKNATPVK